MKVEAKTVINGTKHDVWSIITDIEHAKDNISGIKSIEIINQPNDTLVGLKWKEGRTMFGKEAYETMWITDAQEDEFYQTRAESHGAVYISKFSLEEVGNHCELTMSFEGIPQTRSGKFMNRIFGNMMKKSTLKAVQEDLDDIKKVVETH